MSKPPPEKMEGEKEPDQTFSGESLDNVLSSIRDAVTAHSESGLAGHAPSLALAFDDLRREIAQMRKNLDEKTASPNFDMPELEALIARIVQPLLKTWLDENLPPLAERVIREEIEKLSRER